MLLMFGSPCDLYRCTNNSGRKCRDFIISGGGGGGVVYGSINYSDFNKSLISPVLDTFCRLLAQGHI